MCPELYRKVLFASPLSPLDGSGGKVNFQKKVILANPTHHGATFGGESVNLKQNFCSELNEKSRSAQKSCLSSPLELL